MTKQERQSKVNHSIRLKCRLLIYCHVAKVVLLEKNKIKINKLKVTPLKKK